MQATEISSGWLRSHMERCGRPSCGTSNARRSHAADDRHRRTQLDHDRRSPRAQSRVSSAGKRGDGAYDAASYLASLTVMQPQSVEPLRAPPASGQAEPNVEATILVVVNRSRCLSG
jgi:hypothetical protein